MTSANINSVIEHPAPAHSDSSNFNNPEADNRSAFAAGLMSVMQPIITELDQRISETRSSQAELRGRVELLADDLKQISHDVCAPYDLEPFVRKLHDSKKRIAVVSSILHSTQDRLSRLRASVAKEASRRQALLEGPAPGPPVPSASS